MKPSAALVSLAIATALVVGNSYLKTEPEPGSTRFDSIMGVIVLVAGPWRHISPSGVLIQSVSRF